MFIDQARIWVEGGRGGDGCLSFRREKCVPRGGPDGGNGGRGGDIILRANRNLLTLADFYYHPHYKASPGTHGQGKNKNGRDAEDMLLEVPEGTIIYREDKLFADLSSHGDKICLARGGRGGRGNASFRSRRNRAPRIAERGEPGEKHTIRLELRLLADIGLIGYPNAGKSTFLSRVSAARPKIAPYPFTTLSPNLGIVRARKEFVFADIPGLIENAHAGKGLGDAFLRHIERTRILIHIVDIFGYNGREASEVFNNINNELKSFHENLYRKKQIIVANKMDMPGSEEKLKLFKRQIRKKKVFPVSALRGEGLKAVLEEVYLASERLPIEKPAVKKSFSYIYEPAFLVTREGERFRVTGKKIESMVAMTNFDLEEAVDRLENTIKKMGIETALSRKGARNGDTITIGKHEFTFMPGQKRRDDEDR